MWANPQETGDLVIFTEEILNGKFTFCAVLTTLTRSLSAHPFFTPWKHLKTLRFYDVLGGRERVYWEQMG